MSKVLTLNSAQLGDAENKDIANIVYQSYSLNKKDKARKVKEVWTNVINAQAKLAKAEGWFTNSTLKKDDYEEIMDGFKEVQRHDTPVVESLRSRGLTMSANIGSTVVSKHNVSETEPAKRSINPTQFDRNEVVYQLRSRPLPIIHSTLGIEYRQQGFSYKEDTGLMEVARQVAESSDDMVMSGDSTLAIEVNGSVQAVTGFTDDPDRTGVSISDWSAATTDVLADVKTMWSAMINTNKVPKRANSMLMYMPYNFWTALRDEAYANKGDRSLEEQILFRYPEIAELIPYDDMPAGEIALVWADTRSIQLATAQDLTIVPHMKTNPLQPQTFTVWTAFTPFIHADVNGLTGVVHGT